MDENGNGIISDSEINAAIMTLEKAKREKQRQAQKDAYEKFQSVDNELPQANATTTTDSSKK
jgi:hypothetical protein